jgi:hypothetical protein
MQAGAGWCRVSTSEIRSLVSILWFRLLADRSKNGVCDRFRRCDKGDYIWGLGRLSQEGDSGHNHFVHNGSLCW